MSNDFAYNHNESQADQRPFIGIHLSGANTPKTAVVSLRLAAGQGLVLEGVYEKIASYGSIFSDERLVDIITLHGGAGDVFVDAPLTASPCEMCVRPHCPGVLRCEDLAVAYMLRLNASLKESKRRKRPLNPQSQRLWDVAYSLEKRFHGVDPSFNTNKGPIVARARALAKRLQGLQPQVLLKETSVPHTLATIAEAHPALAHSCRNYRSFEEGLACRREIVQHLGQVEWFRWGQAVARVKSLAQSVEVFHAFIAALVAYMHHCERTAPPPDQVYGSQGWVYLPGAWQEDRLARSPGSQT